MRVRRLLAMAPAVAALVAVPTAQSARAGQGCTPSPSPVDESAMLRMVNAVRARNGLSRLGLLPALSAGARAHGLGMGQSGKLAHQLVRGRLTWAPPGVAAGENVAFAGTTPIAFQMLMQSPPHRKNILGTMWRSLGVGAASTCGTLYFALHFQG